MCRSVSQRNIIPVWSAVNPSAIRNVAKQAGSATVGTTLPGTAIYYGRTLHHHQTKGIVCKFTPGMDAQQQRQQHQ